MVKNIERQRAKKIYKKEQEADPPGVSRLSVEDSRLQRLSAGSVTTCSGRLQTFGIQSFSRPSVQTHDGQEHGVGRLAASTVQGRLFHR